MWLGSGKTVHDGSFNRHGRHTIFTHTPTYRYDTNIQRDTSTTNPVGTPWIRRVFSSKHTESTKSHFFLTNHKDTVYRHPSDAQSVPRPLTDTLQSCSALPKSSLGDHFRRRFQICCITWAHDRVQQTIEKLRKLCICTPQMCSAPG